MKRTCLFIILQIHVCLFAQERLQFVGEKIDFSINMSKFSINGIYVFSNNSNIEISQTILFPFAKNVDSLYVKRVFDLTNNQNISFKYVADGIFFQFVVIPGDTVSINISYSQMTKAENVYILTSTKMWNSPLKFAEYSLTFENDISIQNVSFKPDSIEGNVYYWRKYDFLPSEDFHVSIK